MSPLFSNLIGEMSSMTNRESEQINAWLTVEGIAQYLSVSKETIYRWLERETIPAHKMGKLWRFKRNEVDKWIIKGGAEGWSRKIQPNTSAVKLKGKSHAKK